MSTLNTGAKRDQIAELESLSRNLYENIFNITLIDNSDKSFYAYNLLNKVVFPETLSSEFIEEINLTSDKPWTMLSFELYGTIELWWVIYLLNKPDYIFKAKAGTAYKYIKTKYITNTLQQITNSQ